MDDSVKPCNSMVSLTEPEVDQRSGWSIILCLFLVLLTICVAALLSMMVEGLLYRQCWSAGEHFKLATAHDNCNSSDSDIGENNLKKRTMFLCKGCCKNSRCWVKYAEYCAKCNNGKIDISLDVSEESKR